MPKGPDYHTAFAKADLGEKCSYTIEVKCIKVIVNPVGGLKSGLHLLNEVVKPIWEKRGIHVDVVQTERRGHARELARL